MKMVRGVDTHSLRGTYGERTICEVLREINDLAQEDAAVHAQIRKLLYEAQGMAKRMAKKLGSYNKQWFREWWDANPDFDEDLKRRLAKDYLAHDGGEGGSVR